MTDVDFVIIGAGVAGLGAATALRDAGRSVIILEASDRVGGRAWTVYPEVLGHAWFDMGAIWFHDAENNPLTAIARAAGDKLLRADEIRQERTFVGDRLATETELQAYQAAWGRMKPWPTKSWRSRLTFPWPRSRAGCRTNPGPPR